MTDAVQEQLARGFDIVELRFSPRRWLTQDLGLRAALELASESVSSAGAGRIGLILAVNRMSPLSFLRLVAEEIDRGLPLAIVGVDLTGDDRHWHDDGAFGQVAAAASRAGLGVTVHAGEFGPPVNIWRAIDSYGAVRVAHCLTAISERALLRRMAVDDVLVETSISSNLATGATPRGSVHPARMLLESGVRICLNEDVPWFTMMTIEDEYRLAVEALGLEPFEINALQAQAFDRRFIRLDSTEQGDT